VHLVGFIIRIYHDARPPERQNRTAVYYGCLILNVRQNAHDVATTAVGGRHEQRRSVVSPCEWLCV